MVASDLDRAEASLAGALHAIAPRRLGRIERLVGLDAEVIARLTHEPRHPERGGEVNRVALGLDRSRRDRCPVALGELGRVLPGGAGAEDRRLLAADPVR